MHTEAFEQPIAERIRAAMARAGRDLVYLGIGFATSIVAFVVWVTVMFVLGFVLQFGDVAEALGAWPALVGYLLAGPYVAIARMFDYVDARTQREGWDIQVRFNAIAQAAREAEAKKLGSGAAGVRAA